MALKQKNGKDVTISWLDVIINFFNVVLFLLLILVTGPSFMSVLSLVLELWKFTFIKAWPEIRKSKKSPRLSFAQYLETEPS